MLLFSSVSTACEYPRNATPTPTNIDEASAKRARESLGQSKCKEWVKSCRLFFILYRVSLHRYYEEDQATATATATLCSAGYLRRPLPQIDDSMNHYLAQPPSELVLGYSSMIIIIGRIYHYYLVTRLNHL